MLTIIKLTECEFYSDSEAPGGRSCLHRYDGGLAFVDFEHFPDNPLWEIHVDDKEGDYDHPGYYHGSHHFESVDQIQRVGLAAYRDVLEKEIKTVQEYLLSRSD